MNTDVAEAEAPEQLVARFLCGYHKIWQNYFPGLNKRAHWHVMFSARCSPPEGVSCRSIHRTLYGLYGTDIRTCIERIRDCENDGFVRVLDASGEPSPASPACLVGATDKLREAFDGHCRETFGDLCGAFGDGKSSRSPDIDCDHPTISAMLSFFNAYDQKWRETCELVVRQKGLTPAYANDAMDHLVTYQYWAIVMLLWSASRFGSGRPDAPALVIDEINSRMWDALRLGHLAIKERVSNLIRWGFFAEQTIKKHKAVALTPVAGSAISESLSETKPILHDLYAKLAPREAAA
ncbi:MAG: hypothetical protein JO095_07915 [Alphaproteobacteria bacterium]|nr:hypothetical protein [Alphaproteobacteria bacterium]MBV9815306.1 hypothetical protein [Alphaproteobacteria bacterium]